MARHRVPGREVREGRAALRAARAGRGGLRVLGVRAAELVHEAGDHAVEVQAVVVPPGRPLLARSGNHRIKSRNPTQVQNERFLIRGLPTGAC